MRKSSSIATARIARVSWWQRLLARWRHKDSSTPSQVLRRAEQAGEAAAVRRAELLTRQARIDDILTSPPNAHPHFTNEDRELLRRIRDNLAEHARTHVPK